MRIIDKIEEIMKNKGITRYQIEKNLGIKQSTFKNWVNGTEPGVEKIVAILKYLEVSADQIFEIEKPSEELTKDEIMLLKAYRMADPAMQAAARKLLDVPVDQGKSLISEPGSAAM